MTKDLNHGICNIEYNCINLPSRVDFLDGSKVLYTYDAKRFFVIYHHII